MMKFFRLWIACIIIFCTPGFCLADNSIVRIYAPKTPGCIPLVLAARQIPQLKINLFDSHSKAHALFLRNDAQIICTGLSVGIKFFKQKIPVQMVCSFISGLTYLITDFPAHSFADIKGHTLVIPFEGSPIHETTRFLIKQEGLVAGTDIFFEYSPFQASIYRFKKGIIHAAALPEPFVTQLIADKTAAIAFAYADKWDACTKSTDGYPQVGLFVKKKWADKNRRLIHRLTKALDKAITRTLAAPEKAAAEATPFFPFSAELMKESLERIRFDMLQETPLQQAVNRYYKITGQPLDESFNAFFITD